MGFARGIDHVCVVAKDMDESIDFYTRVLEFTLAGREKLPAAGVEVAQVALGGAVVELVKFTDGRGFHDGDGLIEVIGLRVDDIFAAAERLRRDGVTLLQEEPTKLGENDYFLFFRGPSGERLELVQKAL